MLKRKLIKFDGQNLFIKIDNKVHLLGGITTRKGQLSRVQKLKAVQYTGEWIEL